MEQDLINLLLPKNINPSLQLPDPGLLQYYTDIDNRIIWINDEIDEGNLDLVSKVIDWNRADELAGIPIEERRPIKIYINSPGGDLEVERTISSILLLSKTPIYGYALGMVASAASLIYLSCHKRYALSTAYFIFHRGSCGNLGGNYNEVQAAMEDYKNQIQIMEQFYIKHTNYPEEIIKEKIKSDWYIYCEEALQYGVVTDLIEDISVLF